MQGTVAFELHQEYAGDVKRQTPDGKDETVPKFGGGTLAIPPDGSPFNVADRLSEGKGTIVVDERNTTLVDALRAYPALKETKPPAKPAKVLGVYEHLRDERIAELAAARGHKTGNKSRDQLIDLLESDDVATTPNTNPDAGE